MPIVEFPPIDSADENGLLAIGGDFHPDSLMLAYCNAIFPWPIGEEYPLAWFSPDPRGVFETNNVHIPRKLAKEIKKLDFTVRYNTNFEEVIRNCQRVKRKDESESWITEELIQGFINFFNLGFAYCVEVYNTENELVGGVYGVCIGEFVSGESMFYKENNASKYALLHLLKNLENVGVQYLDTQMVTKVTESLGAKSIDRQDFVNYVHKATKKSKVDFAKFDTSLTI